MMSKITIKEVKEAREAALELLTEPNALGTLEGGVKAGSGNDGKVPIDFDSKEEFEIYRATLLKQFRDRVTKCCQRLEELEVDIGELAEKENEILLVSSVDEKGKTGIIPLTEHLSTGKPGETGRREDEDVIEVTPEMIEAGVDELRYLTNDYISPTSLSLRESAILVYRAMTRSRPQHPWRHTSPSHTPGGCVALHREAAGALGAQDVLLREAANVLRGLIQVRDKTELDRARSLLSRIEAVK